MKGNFKLSVIPAILLICTYLQANPVTTNTLPVVYSFETRELVITFDKFSEKKMDELNETISGIKGIVNAGFCRKYNCLLLTYDRSLFPTSEHASKAVLEQIIEFQPRLKTGVNHAQIQSKC